MLTKDSIYFSSCETRILFGLIRESKQKFLNYKENFQLEL